MSEQLTPQQIENWRNVLLGVIGPYTLHMSAEQIQAYRAQMQKRLDSEAQEAK